MAYLLGTDAIIEILKGSKKYEHFAGEDLFVTDVSMQEVCILVLKEFGEEKAKDVFNIFFDRIIPIDKSFIMDATLFKVENKTSFSDSIGYVVAKEKGLKFLTSNKYFVKFDSVEVC
ncbi:MAG: PIN domain-containing protein [Candidatus Aenigmarchaeota archaeon]|nr:PIN domain-containing protein [Candidatus Aenigmarchaeota archaeon]